MSTGNAWAMQNSGGVRSDIAPTIVMSDNQLIGTVLVDMLDAYNNYLDFGQESYAEGLSIWLGAEL